MIREQLNILINLAVSDQIIKDEEAKIIYMIGKANGLTKDEIEAMIKEPKPIGNIFAFSEDQKFENLYHLIQLMKADGQVFKSEIKFCENIADKLGYKKEVITELSSHIYSDPTITSNRNLLIKHARKFMK